MFILITFVLFKLVAECRGSEVDNYFKEKPFQQNTTIKLCSENEAGILFRLPLPVECELAELGNKSQIVNITTYWPHEGDHRFIGKECFVDSYKKIVGKTFFGIFEPLQSANRVNVKKLTPQECLKMCTTNKTPNGENLAKISPGLIGTNNHKTPSAGWFASSHIQNTNYYISDIRMSVSSEHNIIRPVGTMTIGDCNVETENCLTTRGILIWDKSNHRTCRIMLGKTASCLKTGSHISCPETLNTIIGWTKTNMCGVNVAKATSGVLFSSSKSRELDRDISSHSNIIQQIRGIHGNRVDLGDLSHDGRPTTVQSIMMNQYVFSTLNSKVDAAIHSFHYNQCRNNQLFMATNLHKARNGDIKGLLNALTTDGTYTGRLAGDLVSATKCFDITEFTFVEKTGEFCTLEHPILYTFEDQMQKGFLRPLTHEITPTATLVECPSLPFYFITSSGLIVNLETQQLAEDIPILPNPGLSVLPEKIPEIVFKAEVIWIGGENRTNNFDGDLQAINNMVMIGRMIEKAKNGEAPKGETWDLLATIFSWLANAMMAPIILIIIALIVLIIIVSRPVVLQYVITFCLTVMHLTFNTMMGLLTVIFRMCLFLIRGIIFQFRKLSRPVYKPAVFVRIKQNPRDDIESNLPYLRSIPPNMGQKKE